MLNTLRTGLRRRVVTVMAAPLLLGTMVAAAPAPAAAVQAATADRLAYKDTYYSNAAHTQIVGVGYGFCDGDYIMQSGYTTAYYTTKYYPPCP